MAPMQLLPAPVVPLPWGEGTVVPVRREHVLAVTLWVGLDWVPARGWGASGELVVPIVLRLDLNTFSLVPLIRWLLFLRVMRVKPSFL